MSSRAAKRTEYTLTFIGYKSPAFVSVLGDGAVCSLLSFSYRINNTCVYSTALNRGLMYTDSNAEEPSVIQINPICAYLGATNAKNSS